MVLGATSVRSESGEEPPGPLHIRPIGVVKAREQLLFLRAGSHDEQGECQPTAQEEEPVGRLRHSVGWMHSFIENPHLFYPESEMPAFGPPELTHQEVEELSRYLGSLRAGAGPSCYH